MGNFKGEYQDVAYTKTQHYLLSNLTKNSIGHFESNTTSYFDRIVMEMVLIGFKNGRAQVQPIQMWECILQSVHHHIKIAYRTYKNHQNTKETPMIGPG